MVDGVCEQEETELADAVGVVFWYTRLRKDVQ